jgi:hypothetical protein
MSATPARPSFLRLVAALLWEAPQCLLGAALLGAVRARGGVAGLEWDQGRLFARTPGIGISLGLFVFWFDEGNRYFRGDPLMRRHEHGHTFQSRWLGPLYLPLVGVPSTLRAAYAVLHREVTGRRWQGYYDGYPESWADRLGGISRAERAAAVGG